VSRRFLSSSSTPTFLPQLFSQQERLFITGVQNYIFNSVNQNIFSLNRKNIRLTSLILQPTQKTGRQRYRVFSSKTNQNQVKGANVDKLDVGFQVPDL
jgi:hypothetical protein